MADLPPFRSFQSTVSPFTPANWPVNQRLLVNATTGAPVGLQTLNSNAADGVWVPVDLSAAQIAAPTAAMIDDLNAMYRLDEPPYTRYYSNGTALVEFGTGGGGSVINTETITTVLANTVTVPAGTNYVVVEDSINAVNTLTVGGGFLPDGYDLWMTFPNGGVFSGLVMSAHGNLTLKVLGGGWSILSKFG